METLILNSSKKIDEIRSIFDSYKVDINLNNPLPFGWGYFYKTNNYL